MHIVTLINSEILVSRNKHDGDGDDNDDDNNNNNLQAFLESNSAFLLTNTRFEFIFCPVT
jgi:hypothetical protein